MKLYPDTDAHENATEENTGIYQVCLNGSPLKGGFIQYEPARLLASKFIHALKEIGVVKKSGAQDFGFDNLVSIQFSGGVRPNGFPKAGVYLR